MEAKELAARTSYNHLTPNNQPEVELTSSCSAYTLVRVFNFLKIVRLLSAMVGSNFLLT